MEILTIILFVAGLVIMVVGAEELVKGASRIAARLGVSGLVIGLTVVALGTSAPEIAVGVVAALQGQGDIAVGNVLGSNVFNVLFILGLSAAITPLLVAHKLVRIDVPIMIVASVVLGLMALDGRISTIEGALLFGGLIGYILFLIRAERGGSPSPETADPAQRARGSRGRSGNLAYNIGLIVVGLALLILGSRWVADSATEMARALGLSELIIGLTVVAVGTSLPEAATSVTAALRGERDMAVGNIVGSNLFNILGVMGLVGLAAPGGVEVSSAALNFDIPVMIAVAFACLPIFFTGYRIARWEGALLFGYYLAYTAFLLLDAAEHDAITGLSTIMLFFVIPLTVVTLAVISFRSLIQARRATR